MQVKAAGAGGEGMEKLGLEKLRSQVGVAEPKKKRIKSLKLSESSFHHKLSI